MDWFEPCLLTLLGAAVANLVDAIFSFTPRLAAWLNRVLFER